MFPDVYISATSHFLPGLPIGNDEMESLLGALRGEPSRARKIVLRNNGIRSRHYAIDPLTRAPTHTNVDMTCAAIHKLLHEAQIPAERIGALVCGTSSPDQMIPCHGHLVQGALGWHPMDAFSTMGVCGAGATALKDAWLRVVLGEVECAVATGSECASAVLKSENYEEYSSKNREEELEKDGHIGFEREFLRWMLSDGAGAVLLSRDPLQGATNLRVDFIEHVSMAGSLPTCMYMGADKTPDGSFVPWRQAQTKSSLTIAQDAKLLSENIGVICFDVAFDKVRKKHEIKPEQISWFLPHLSSHFFRLRMEEKMEEMSFDLKGKWFTNLSEKGNTGAASIYIMLDELLKTKALQVGEKILCMVPESARFSCTWMQFTVTHVAPSPRIPAAEGSCP